MSVRRNAFEVGQAVFGVEVALDDACPWPDGRVRIQRLWGARPTWEGITVALWWGHADGDPLGEQLWQWSRAAAAHRRYPWRVEHRLEDGGAEEWRVLIQDETAKEWGTAGRPTSVLRLSSRGEVEVLDCPIEDLHVYFDEVPCTDQDVLEHRFRDAPPREVPCGVEHEWNAPAPDPDEGIEGDSLKAVVMDAFRFSDEELSAIRRRLHEEYIGDGPAAPAPLSAFHMRLAAEYAGEEVE